MIFLFAPYPRPVPPSVPVNRTSHLFPNPLEKTEWGPPRDWGRGALLPGSRFS